MRIVIPGKFCIEGRLHRHYAESACPTTVKVDLVRWSGHRGVLRRRCRFCSIEPVEFVRRKQDEMNHRSESEQEDPLNNHCSQRIEKAPYSPHGSYSYSVCDMNEYTAACTPPNSDLQLSAPGNQLRQGMPVNVPTRAMLKTIRNPNAKTIQEVRL
jgi:hypothetical protein